MEILPLGLPELSKSSKDLENLKRSKFFRNEISENPPEFNDDFHLSVSPTPFLRGQMSSDCVSERDAAMLKQNVPSTLLAYLDMLR